MACLGLTIAASELASCGDDCGAGTVENNGECVLIPAECGPGTTLTDGNICVASRTGCGPFTALDPVTRECVPSGSLCGSGTSFDETANACVPTTEVICGPGTVQQGRVCVLAFEPCADGQVLIDDECIDGGALQLIHNAPDPALTTVDVYVNGELIVDNAAFRTASPFIPFESGTEVTVVIAESSSTDATPVTPAATTTFTIGTGDRIAVIVGGVVDTSDFAPGIPALALDTIAGVRSSADDGLPANQYNLAVYNGAPDVGTVTATVGGTAIPGIAYGTLTPYQALARGVSLLSVGSSVLTPPLSLQTSAGASPIAAPNGVPAGTALIVLTSGFFDTVANNGGPSLAVVAALPTGGPLYVLDSGTRLQFVHNARDVAAVDAYIGEALVAEGLDYRAATAFVAAPGGDALMRVFAAGDDPATATPLIATEATLTTASVVVLDGLGSAPTTADDALALHVIADARTTATSSTVASVALFNGIPASLPFAASSFGTALFSATAYGASSGYVDLPPTKLPLDMTSGGDRLGSIQTSAAGFYTSLSAGGAWLLFATGDASEPAAIGFALIPPTGGSFAFAEQAARGQVVHAAGLAEGANVDVYVNGFLAVNDLAYTAATPMAGVPGGSNVTLALLPAATGAVFGEALPGATPVLATLTNPNFALGVPHHIVAYGGTLAEVGLTATAGQETGVSASFADLRLFNAVSNATLAFENEGADSSSEVDDTTFGLGVDFGAFSVITFNLVPAPYGVEAADAERNAFAPPARGSLDLTGAAGQSVLLVAAGYVTPPVGSTDREIRLIAVGPDGSSTQLPSLP
ncbi:MAG: DUF4397 domain-containing protein [Myxococcota bacterium]